MTENTDKKKLPIGIENFEKIRRDDFYYIDKTGLLRELLNNWGEVNLFTRPDCLRVLTSQRKQNCVGNIRGSFRLSLFR